MFLCWNHRTVWDMLKSLWFVLYRKRKKKWRKIKRKKKKERTKTSLTYLIKRRKKRSHHPTEKKSKLYTPQCRGDSASQPGKRLKFKSLCCVCLGSADTVRLPVQVVVAPAVSDLHHRALSVLTALTPRTAHAPPTETHPETAAENPPNGQLCLHMSLSLLHVHL